MQQYFVIAYRARGQAVWSYHFSLKARSWKSFYRQARRDRRTSVYAIVRHGLYTEVL